MNDNSTAPSRFSGSALVAVAIVAAAGIIAFASSDEPPRYQVVATSNAVVRMDTDSGAMIACDLQRCVTIQPPDRAIAARSLQKLLPGQTNAQ